jgi:hypothetical protein
MRNLMGTMPFVAFALGCEETVIPSEYGDCTLEQATVVPDDPLEGSRRDGSGALSGSLEGTDLEFRVGTSAGLQVVDVHAPGRPDLSAYAGTDVLMSILEVAPPADASLVIKDDSGEVIYLIETVLPSDLTTETFGSNFVDRGNDLGETAAYRSTMQLFSAMVATDNGQVEAFPGQPIEIVVGGLSYRFMLTASWDRELDRDAVYNCTIRSTVLAYDVSRVEPGTANLTPLDRDEAFSIEQGTCALPPTNTPGGT